MPRVVSAAGLLLLLQTAPSYPHAIGTSGPAVLDWHNEHIARVVSASYSWNNLGVTAINAAGEVVDGRTASAACAARSSTSTWPTSTGSISTRR